MSFACSAVHGDMFHVAALSPTPTKVSHPCTDAHCHRLSHLVMYCNKCVPPHHMGEPCWALLHCLVRKAEYPEKWHLLICCFRWHTCKFRYFTTSSAHLEQLKNSNAHRETTYKKMLILSIQHAWWCWPATSSAAALSATGKICWALCTVPTPEHPFCTCTWPKPTILKCCICAVHHRGVEDWSLPSRAKLRSSFTKRKTDLRPAAQFLVSASSAVPEQSILQ